MARYFDAKHREIVARWKAEEPIAAEGVLYGGWNVHGKLGNYKLDSPTVVISHINPSFTLQRPTSNILLNPQGLGLLSPRGGNTGRVRRCRGPRPSCAEASSCLPCFSSSAASSDEGDGDGGGIGWNGILGRTKPDRTHEPECSHFM